MSARRTYDVSVDTHRVLLGEDSEEGLFLLIEQRTGIPRVSAEPLLEKGMMLASGDLCVMRRDVILRALEAKS